MLEKDELVRELILLLLRSLKGKDGEVTTSASPVRLCRRSDKHLHQLEVFEARQFLRHDSELVSIQIPEQRREVSLVNQTEVRRHLSGHRYKRVQLSRVIIPF